MTALPTALLFGLAMTALLTGCAVDLARNEDARPVNLADFARPPEPQALESDSVQAELAANALAALLGKDRQEVEEPVVWPLELDERVVLRPTRVGDTVIVDSLVGHVNGRPIFADEFLEPIEDRLLRAAEQLGGQQRNRSFRSIINTQLTQVIENELILAEAQASLTPEQQRGVIGWLRHLYDEEIRKGGGTRSGAERRRASSGQELDQYLGEQKDLMLIHQMRLEKISPRVNVSWRDIEREYQRRYDEFNPSSTVTLARIRLSASSQPEVIESVTRRLQGGESFTAIARELGYADGGVWETFEMGPGGITDIDVRDEMKAALHDLNAGDTTQPLRLGLGVFWLHVVSLETPKTYSIYDPRIQLGLKNAIRAARDHAEWQRYVNSLMQEGVTDDLEDMADRLFAIAIRRYYP